MRISFAERMKGMKGTSVRNKLFDDPMLISFAAGKPEGKLFPADELIPSVIEILQRDYQEALQYSDTEGIPDLRSLIAEQRMREAGVRTTADRITLTSGSQEGIEMSAKIFVNPGDVIICENPSYVGALYSMETTEKKAASILAGHRAYRKKLEELAGFSSELAAFLAKSANQFVSRRESTDGETILAGFPFFEDWGRDTMIALPGICISTRQYGTAREILRTFAAYEKDGLMPNLFPEGGEAPLYNTVDAALLFINCVYLYYQATGEKAFVREMYPVAERIVKSYRQGTHFGIHMDEDGLIMAGQELDQVTWMDVRVGEFLPTPRHGKPVEINAYWYNALQIMACFSEILGKEGAEYEALAKKAKEAFCGQFWMEDRHCLKDVLSGTEADCQVRCNQIWAVSMPFTMLDREKERQVVETVFEKLYTPYGLRTLEKSDPQFHGTYGGPMQQRDMAYHQGTVWTFPLGAYYLSYLKVHSNSGEAKETVREQLEVLASALREGCVGQLPEIYDGENPTSSKGCFAQAWSVGELLRVFEKIERGN